MVNYQEYFISCDWGTTNFRLKLVRTDTLEVLNSYSSNEGVKSLSIKWQIEKIDHSSKRFKEFLISKIKELDPPVNCKYIIASGMVTSNIGMFEVAYSQFPFDFDGGLLRCEEVAITEELSIILVSGVRNNEGMMRGEEAQSVGLTEYLPRSTSGTLILPGTHSKHIKFSDGQFIGTQTFLTGELFQLLLSHSILANSVRESPFEGEVIQAFIEGVTKGYNNRIGSLLFSIRARDILHSNSSESNFYYLSGLLIGDELSCVDPEYGKIFMAPPRQLYLLYKTALETLFDEAAYTVFSMDQLDKALLKGHKTLLLKNLN